MAAMWPLGRWGARMARIGDVQGDPNLVLVSTVEGSRW
jgi:hypothetical protein